MDDKRKEKRKRKSLKYLSKQDIPNDETKAAMNEFEEMKSNPEKYKRYHSVDVMFDEILNND